MARLKDYEAIIREDVEDLEQHVKGATDAMTLRRAQLLLLLKSGWVDSAEHAAWVVGYHPTYAQKLMRDYAKGGLDSLIRPRRPPEPAKQRAKSEHLAALRKAIAEGTVTSSPEAREFLVAQGLPYSSDSAVYRLLRRHRMLPDQWRRRRTTKPT